MYTVQSPGFESTNKEIICKLNRALYCLKQASWAWYERAHYHLVGLGFTSSHCDPSLFIYSRGSTCLYLLIYVDDILISGSLSTLVHDLIHKLNAKFALKQLGQLDYFLGIEVKHLWTQSKYIWESLSHENMSDAEVISSPMTSSYKLAKLGADSVSNPYLYHSIVGALQYATLTRPNIAYNNKVCQFTINLLESHYWAVKRILC